jgi:hypothetical protein
MVLQEVVIDDSFQKRYLWILTLVDSLVEKEDS